MKNWTEDQGLRSRYHAKKREQGINIPKKMQPVNPSSKVSWKSNLQKRVSDIFFNSKQIGWKIYRRESVAGIGDEHASLAYSAITNSNTLDEPGCTH